jgi:hypothetical protein
MRAPGLALSLARRGVGHTAGCRGCSGLQSHRTRTRPAALPRRPACGVSHAFPTCPTCINGPSVPFLPSSFSCFMLQSRTALAPHCGGTDHLKARGPHSAAHRGGCAPTHQLQLFFRAPADGTCGLTIESEQCVLCLRALRAVWSASALASSGGVGARGTQASVWAARLCVCHACCERAGCPTPPLAAVARAGRQAIACVLQHASGAGGCGVSPPP